MNNELKEKLVAIFIEDGYTYEEVYKMLFYADLVL